jgi:hypothetical protein
VVDLPPLDAMHPVEAKLYSCLEAGEAPSVSGLGGIKAIFEGAGALGLSPLMPECLSAVLQYWPSAAQDEQALAEEIVRILLDTSSLDFALMEAIDVLDSSRPLPGEADETCFTTLLAKAGKNQCGVSGLARSAGLEGAFRWALSNRRWQLRLLDFLLGLECNDDPDFLRHAARIAGIAYSHWRERDLLQKLIQMTNVDSSRVDASFELGMAFIADALDAPGHEAAHTLIEQAKAWLTESILASDANPEARLYIECLQLLTNYGNGKDGELLANLRDQVCANLFELTAWHLDDNSPSWLGARHTEAVCWSALANTLTVLAERLDEVSWWEPSVVVEQYVLAAYTAGRSILNRRHDGGIEKLIRPRITGSIARQAGQAYAVRTWLKLNSNHEWADEAKALLNKIDETLTQERTSRNPSGAATAELMVAALIKKSQIPQSAKECLLEVISNAILLQLDNLTASESEVIEKCRETVQKHPDHRDNPRGQRLFDTVLLWIVRFLSNRLEITKQDDPTVAYLFERDELNLPHENELQDDFFRWLWTNAAGSDLEPTNLGGGRADIRLKSGSERLVIEVKRELSDCSFEALSACYASQTSDYQNVSIRLGFLLVLDLTAFDNKGTPHITSLIQTKAIQRAGEEVSRMITMIKIPGRRMRPSDLTKRDKAAWQRGQS